VRLVRTDVADELIASIFRVEKSVRQLLRLFFVRGFYFPEDAGDTFLRNVSSYKTHTTPHPRRGHCSNILIVARN
jgi:hypothetical protein